MYIEFNGEQIEEFKEMHIDTSTISNEAYLLINKKYIGIPNRIDKVKTVFDDVVNHLKAKRIVYCITTYPDAIETKYKEIMNAREIAAKSIDKLIRDKVKNNKEKEND